MPFNGLDDPSFSHTLRGPPRPRKGTGGPVESESRARAREAERSAVLAMLDHCFSPARPLVVSPAVHAEAMKDPALRLRADRMLVSRPLRVSR
jgi:hypothetical protein